MGRLASAWRKLERGKSHIDTLSEEILDKWAQRIADNPPFDINVEADNKAGCLVIRVRNVESLPALWPLIVGDALGNFRSVLDHAAWQMVQAGSKPGVAPEDVYWPIQIDTNTARLAGRYAHRLPGVDHKHLAVLDASQPYKQGAAAASHPLAVLSELSRVDKHRDIVVLIGREKRYNLHFDFRHFAVERQEAPPSDTILLIREDAELGRIWGRRTGPEDPEVKVGPVEGSLVVAFGDGTDVLNVLDGMTKELTGILKKLEALL